MSRVLVLVCSYVSVFGEFFIRAISLFVIFYNLQFIYLCILYIRIDEKDLLNQLIEKAFACKSGLREIVNLSSAYVNEDITIISEKLTIAIKAGYLFLTVYFLKRFQLPI